MSAWVDLTPALNEKSHVVCLTYGWVGLSPAATFNRAESAAVYVSIREQGFQTVVTIRRSLPRILIVVP